MRVRHLVASSNVHDGVVADATRVRHGTIRAGRVAALAGPIDPWTHLNVDFAEHQCLACVVVEELEVGAAALLSQDGFQTAAVPTSAFEVLGRVDVGARRAEWLAAFTR